MNALRLVDDWPVPHVGGAVVTVADDALPVVVTHGDPHRSYRLASISKPMTAWAVLVAVEEGVVSLDDPVGQPGCTLRHLLAHAGGYGFDGPDPITGVGTRRIYSNTGIELAADHLAHASGIAFDQYLTEAVLQPLGMTATELRGSPAHGVHSTVHDVVRFALELIRPALVSQPTAELATTPVFPGLRGMVPGVGSYPDCVWGLGIEIKGAKHPHWMGTRNSPAAFGHFGGAGTLLWVDPGAVHERAIACVALTDRPFDDWAAQALQLWPAFSDAVIGEQLAGAGGVPEAR